MKDGHMAYVICFAWGNLYCLFSKIQTTHGEIEQTLVVIGDCPIKVEVQTFLDFQSDSPT